MNIETYLSARFAEQEKMEQKNYSVAKQNKSMAELINDHCYCEVGQKSCDCKTAKESPMPPTSLEVTANLKELGAMTPHINKTVESAITQTHKSDKTVATPPIKETPNPTKNNSLSKFSPTLWERSS